MHGANLCSQYTRVDQDTGRASRETLGPDARESEEGTSKPPGMSSDPQDPAPPSDLPVIGNYRLLRELGRGAMGTVYLAHQESLARDLALKVLAPEFTREPEFLERFRREARIAASLKHPHIAQVYDADFRDGQYYIAMEYLGSRNLRDLIRECAGPFPLAQVLSFLDPIMQALGHAHSRGVIHRDVKPANVLIDEEGRVALTDFSIARATSEGALTRSGTMIGTPEYMAPEQFEGLEVDGRTDLYAVAVIAYELLTGVHPFRAETTPAVMKAHLFKRPAPPSELVAELAPLDPVILKALEKDPDERHPDVETFRRALLEAGGLQSEKERLNDFLAAILQGKISMDEAVRAHALVKEAIDQEFRRVQTVLIADLAGSSRLKQPDRTLHADSLFRTYRKAVNESLEAHGCRSYEWSGDGVLGLFESAAEAVLAGLRIQARLEEICQTLGSPGLLSARIGINTGSLYLDPRRSLGEFASRTVDEAGHLQKDCPPGGVALSEATMLSAGAVADSIALGRNRDGVAVYLAHPTGSPLKCPGCASTIPAKGRFCPGCGRNLAVPPPRIEEVPPALQPGESGGHGTTGGMGPAAPAPTPPPGGSGGHGATGGLRPAAPAPTPPPGGSGGHGTTGGMRPAGPAPTPPPGGSGGHGTTGGLRPAGPAPAPPPGGSGGHSATGGLRPASPAPASPPGGSGGHSATGGLRPASPAPAPPPGGSGGHAPHAAWSSPPSRPSRAQPGSRPLPQDRSSAPDSHARRTPPRPGGVWWGWAFLGVLLMVMFAGGVVGEETALGGALLFGGMAGAFLLAVVSPVMSIVYLVGSRVSLGLQAAAAALLLWGMIVLTLLMA